MASYCSENPDDIINHLFILSSGMRLRIIMRVLKNSPVHGFEVGVGAHLVAHNDLTSMGLSRHPQCKPGVRLWFEGHYGGMPLLPFEKAQRLNITGVGAVVSEAEKHRLIVFDREDV